MTQTASISTRAQLLTAIADELDRTDLDTVIQLWPKLCEAEVNRTLRHFMMLETADLAGAPDYEYVDLPDDWEETFNVKIGTNQLTYQSRDMLDKGVEKYAGLTTQPTTPAYYTHFGNRIRVWPVPSAAYTVTLEYYQSIPPLADQTDGINWLLTRAPDVYLYGSLKHSAPHLLDDPRIALWDKLYGDALAALQDASEIARVSGSRMTSQPKVRL